MLPRIESSYSYKLFLSKSSLRSREVLGIINSVYVLQPNFADGKHERRSMYIFEKKIHYISKYRRLGG